MKIIGTGLSGLIGSRMTELLGEEYEFEDMSRKTGADITDASEILRRLQKSDAPIVLHMAAYTNVDGAEEDKELKENSIAWKINVEGTRNALSAAEKTGKRFVHVSTDMVFPGTKNPPERYTEEDATGPVGWYATTKAEAEKIVESASVPWTILRIAYPYHANLQKKSYVTIFKSFLEEGKELHAVADHFFTPTFIDDLADVFRHIFSKNLTGIFHAGGKDSMSPYQIALAVAEVFGLDADLVKQTTRAKFFAGKAPRAFNLSLNSDKIEKLGVRLRGFAEGLEEIKKQLLLSS